MLGWRRRDESGMVAVLVAFSLLALLGVAAIALDGGNARQTKRQAQSSADTAALAGLADLVATPGSVGEQKAVDGVKRYAYVNMGIDPEKWTGCDADVDIPIGWRAPDDSVVGLAYDHDNRCILVNDRGTTLMITHLPSTQLQTFLGQVVGVDNINVSARATATVTPGTFKACALCIVGTGTPLQMQNGDLIVQSTSGLGVAVNGSGTTMSNGSASVYSPGGEIIMYNNGTAQGNFSPIPSRVAVPFPDPLASIAAPEIANGPIRSGEDCKGPGIYIKIPTNCAMASGLYVITGQTHISGLSTIKAGSGVTFYFTCGTGTGSPRPCNKGETGADLICSGSAAIELKAPATGPYRGMAVFFDRNNAGVFDCRGISGSAVTGTVYGKSASLIMRGGGSCDLTGLVVIEDLYFDGNTAQCKITFNEDQNVRVPYSKPGLIQ